MTTGCALVDRQPDDQRLPDAVNEWSQEHVSRFAGSNGGDLRLVDPSQPDLRERGHPLGQDARNCRDAVLRLDVPRADVRGGDIAETRYGDPGRDGHVHFHPPAGDRPDDRLQIGSLPGEGQRDHEDRLHRLGDAVGSGRGARRA